MKSLYLIRHAKSSWDHPDLTDFERPLNTRGERSAPLMGDVLAKEGYRPDRIVSSPAARAIATANLIAGKLGYAIDRIETDPRIYEAGLDALIEVIVQWDDALDSVALVGHNPGITWLANHLTGERIDNVPTCGIVEIELAVRRWADVRARAGHQRAFLSPRLYER